MARATTTTPATRRRGPPPGGWFSLEYCQSSRSRVRGDTPASAARTRHARAVADFGEGVPEDAEADYHRFALPHSSRAGPDRASRPDNPSGLLVGRGQAIKRSPELGRRKMRTVLGAPTWCGDPAQPARGRPRAAGRRFTRAS